MWHAWNVDRLYMGGVQIKHRAHAGLNHQKSVILYDQNGSLPGDQPLVIFGSSNWTSPSAAGQVEHNIFTTKPDRLVVRDQFDRKWNNTGGIVENVVRAAAARCAEIGRRPLARPASARRSRCMVRRSVGAPLRPLSRHQLGLHDCDRCSPNLAETAVEDRRPARSATRCRRARVRARPTTGTSSARRWR